MHHHNHHKEKGSGHQHYHTIIIMSNSNTNNTSCSCSWLLSAPGKKIVQRLGIHPFASCIYSYLCPSALLVGMLFGLSTNTRSKAAVSTSGQTDMKCCMNIYCPASCCLISLSQDHQFCPQKGILDHYGLIATRSEKSNKCKGYLVTYNVSLFYLLRAFMLSRGEFCMLDTL